MAEHGRAREMAKRGRKYREDVELELYGEEVRLQIKPLVDDDFLPIMGFIMRHFDVDEEEIRGGKTVERAQEEIEDARDEEGNIDPRRLDGDFVAKMQEAAILGLTADYDNDGNRVPFDEEQAREFVEGLHGGYSMEIANEILELSGNIREAEKFRGGRGSL